MQRDKAISNWNDNVGNIFNHNRLKIIALMTVFWSVHWAQKVRMKVICCFAVNTLTQSILSIARVERWDVMRALSSWDVIQLLVMALVRGEAFFERNQATGNWWQTLIDCFFCVVSPSLPQKITNKQSKTKDASKHKFTYRFQLLWTLKEQEFEIEIVIVVSFSIEAFNEKI